MEGSYIRAQAELGTSNGFIPVSHQLFQLIPNSNVKVLPIIQQYATQEPPSRCLRLKRRVQTAKLTLAATTIVSTSKRNQLPPVSSQIDWTTVNRRQGWKRESGFAVRKATVHSTPCKIFPYSFNSEEFTGLFWVLKKGQL